MDNTNTKIVVVKRQALPPVIVRIMKDRYPVWKGYHDMFVVIKWI